MTFEASKKEETTGRSLDYFHAKARECMKERHGLELCAETQL
jgi:hypothetical protein